MFPHLITAVAQNTNPPRVLWFSSRHTRLFKKDVKTGSNKEMCDIHHNRLFSFVLCNRTSRVLTLTVGVTSHTHTPHTQIHNPSPLCVDTGQTCPAGRHGPAYESPLPLRLENQKKSLHPRFASTSSPSRTNGTNKQTAREVTRPSTLWFLTSK